MIDIYIYEHFGPFAENKKKAKGIRENIILPFLRKGGLVVLDFARVESATQSFIHVLLSHPIRELGEPILEMLQFRNCNVEIRNIIEIVCEYMQDSIVATTEVDEYNNLNLHTENLNTHTKNDLIMNVEPIINARFKKFRDSNGLNNMPDGEAFERFVNHAIFSSHQPDAFSADTELLDKVCVGGRDDAGIDGLSIKLNGLLIRDIQEAKDILMKFKRASLEFIFVQSKYKPYFDKGELNNFIDGVRDFLSEKHRMPMNEKLIEMLKIKNFLLSDEIILMWEKNPSVRLYYVAMGTWKDSPHQIALSEQLKDDVKSLNIYDQIEVHFVDRDGLKNICDNNENNFTASVSTIDIMSLTSVENVTDSCIALCYADEFMKILSTDEGLIRKSLFDDNVRDYQGINNINREIENTIKDEPSKFILLNNGITIVCDDYAFINRRLSIKNPQIVNGCQTSHVLFFAYKSGLDVSKVPLNIKIISTDNLEVSNQIVRGTNRQNIVMDEAFEATKKFHKDLEDFVAAMPLGQSRIYYERRSKQFSHNPTIKQTDKFNLRILIQSFVGMFLDKPHEAHAHESRLLSEYTNKIFLEHQSKLPYYVSVLTFLLLEDMFRSELINKKELYAFRMHLMAAFRESIAGKCPNINNERAIDEHSKMVLNFLQSKEKYQKRFLNISDVFRITKDKWVYDLKRTVHGIKDVSDFTTIFLSEINKHFKPHNQQLSLNENEKFVGKVKKVLPGLKDKPWGFIERQPEDIFFHSNANKGVDFAQIEGRLVSYMISTNPKDGRLVAINIEVVN